MMQEESELRIQVDIDRFSLHDAILLWLEANEFITKDGRDDVTVVAHEECLTAEFSLGALMKGKTDAVRNV